MNRLEGFQAMNAKVIVLPKRDFNYVLSEASIKRRLVKKRVLFFWAQRKRKPRQDTIYLLLFLGSFLVRVSLLMTSFRFVFWSVFVFPSQAALRQIFVFLLMPSLVLFHVPLAVFCLVWRSFQLSYAFFSTCFKKTLDDFPMNRRDLQFEEKTMYQCQKYQVK